MKHIYILCFFVVSFCSSSQGFTNGSVFNYSVNDTIVTDYIQYPTGWGGPTSPPVTTYRIFKQKHYSANQDTVFYQIEDYVVAYPGCVGCQPAVTHTVQNFVVTALNSSAINYSLLTCHGQIDNSFVNNCGMNEHSIDAGGAFGSCFEPNQEHYRIIEGVGRFHLFRSGSGTGFGDETKLVAYHKVSQPACGGAIGAFPTGINEWKTEDTRLTIYPNPSNGYFTIDTKTEILFQLQNLMGEELKSAKLSPGNTLLDLTDQPQGIYILTCKTVNKIYTVKIVKQ